MVPNVPALNRAQADALTFRTATDQGAAPPEVHRLAVLGTTEPRVKRSGTLNVPNIAAKPAKQFKTLNANPTALTGSPPPTVAIQPRGC